MGHSHPEPYLDQPPRQSVLEASGLFSGDAAGPTDSLPVPWGPERARSWSQAWTASCSPPPAPGLEASNRRQAWRKGPGFSGCPEQFPMGLRGFCLGRLPGLVLSGRPQSPFPEGTSCTSSPQTVSPLPTACLPQSRNICPPQPPTRGCSSSPEGSAGGARGSCRLPREQPGYCRGRQGQGGPPVPGSSCLLTFGCCDGAIRQAAHLNARPIQKDRQLATREETASVLCLQVQGHRLVLHCEGESHCPSAPTMPEPASPQGSALIGQLVLHPYHSRRSHCLPIAPKRTLFWLHPPLGQQKPTCYSRPNSNSRQPAETPPPPP